MSRTGGLSSISERWEFGILSRAAIYPSGPIHGRRRDPPWSRAGLDTLGLPTVWLFGADATPERHPLPAASPRPDQARTGWPWSRPLGKTDPLSRKTLCGKNDPLFGRYQGKAHPSILQDRYRLPLGQHGRDGQVTVLSPLPPCSNESAEPHLVHRPSYCIVLSVCRFLFLLAARTPRRPAPWSYRRLFIQTRSPDCLAFFLAASTNSSCCRATHYKYCTAPASFASLCDLSPDQSLLSAVKTHLGAPQNKIDSIRLMPSIARCAKTATPGIAFRLCPTRAMDQPPLASCEAN